MEVGFVARLSGYVADALRYWEPRRLVFNAVLGCVVLGHFLLRLPESRNALTFDFGLIVFLLAVIANICYCAVYVADLFVQFSGLHAAWQRGRVLLLVVGTAFAATITHFVVQGLFAPVYTSRLLLLPTVVLL
jgi:hypothetical protein